MKLAEALIERAEMQKVIAALESRMMQNVKIQEGDEAAARAAVQRHMLETLEITLQNMD